MSGQVSLDRFIEVRREEAEEGRPQAEEMEAIKEEAIRVES